MISSQKSVNLVKNVENPPNRSCYFQVGGKGSRGVKFRMVARFYDIHHCKDKEHSFFIKNTSNHLEKDGTEYVDADFDLTTTARRLIVVRAG